MNWNILNFDWMKTDGYAAILMYIMCVIWCKWCISKITSASADIQCYFHFHLFQWLVISYLRKHNRCILSKLFSHQLSNVQMPALLDQMKYYGVKGFALMFNEHGMHLMICKNIYIYARVTYSLFDALIEWYGVYGEYIAVSSFKFLIEIVNVCYYIYSNTNLYLQLIFR